MVSNRRISTEYTEKYTAYTVYREIKCPGARELGSRDMIQEAILIKTRNENLNYYDDKKVGGVYQRNCRVEVTKS